MSEEKRRYFWCDAPSPLHEVLQKAHADANESIAAIRSLARSFGAKAFAGRDGFVSGFIFDGDPPSSVYQWKKAGACGDGNVYYIPQKRSREGKELSRRMSMRWYEPAREAVVYASGMSVDVIVGRYFCRTSCGFKDDRIFLSVPVSDQEFPDIPNYLIECKEWEMKRWFDLGRAGVEASEAA